MCLNHKYLTYNKANIDLWCRAIWVLWIFGNNIDLGQYCCLRSIKLHIAVITVPYLYNIYLNTCKCYIFCMCFFQTIIKPLFENRWQYLLWNTWNIYVAYLNEWMNGLFYIIIYNIHFLCLFEKLNNDAWLPRKL